MTRRKSIPRQSLLAYLYCRDSGGPAQEQSVEDQRAALTVYAAAHGYTVSATYIDEAISGRTDARPGFQALIADATTRTATVGTVLVWDYARFGREENDRAFYLALLAKHGVTVRSITQPLPDLPVSGILREALAFTDAEYSRRLAVDVKRGHMRSLAQGFIPGTVPPVGYRAERAVVGTHRNGEPRYGTRWVIDEALAPRVRTAFQMRAAGQTIRAIMRATDLHTTRQGYHEMLRNPTYRGVYVYGATEYPNIVPALVDAATWAACQVQDNLHPRRIASDYLLSGLARCGYCGAALSGFSSRKRFKNGTEWHKRYYICSNRNSSASERSCRAPIVSADMLELAIKELVFRDLLAEDVFPRFVAAARESANLSETLRQVEISAREISQAQRAINDLLSLAGQGIMSVELLAEKIKSKEVELRESQARQNALQQLPALLVAGEAEVRAMAEHLRTQLSGDIAGQRWVLRQVIAQLTYGPEITLVFRPPPS